MIDIKDFRIQCDSYTCLFNNNNGKTYVRVESLLPDGFFSCAWLIYSTLRLYDYNSYSTHNRI